MYVLNFDIGFWNFSWNRNCLAFTKSKVIGLDLKLWSRSLTHSFVLFATKRNVNVPSYLRYREKLEKLW